MAEKSFGVKEINLIGASGTPTIESPNNLNLNAVNVAISTNATIGGNLTVSGTVGIAGTLTYEDVTNIDAIGIITARNGVNLTGGNLSLGDSGGSSDDRISIGAGGDINIYHNGTDSYVSNATGDLRLFSVGGSADDVLIRAQDDIELQPNNGQSGVKVIGTGAVELYHNNSKKLETSSSGAIVTGTLAATAVTGDGSGLTGIAVTEAPVTDYTISANGSSAYRIHGGGVDETANSPDLYLIRGQKYRFNNTTGSSHPFAIRVSDGGSAYTDGVSGDDEGVQLFTVPYDAPAKIFYQCTIHGGMVGNIYIRGANGQNDNVGVTTFSTFLQVLGQAGTSDKGLEVRANSTQNTDTNKAIRVRNNSTTDTFNLSYKGQGYFAGKVAIGTDSTSGANGLTVYKDDTSLGNTVLIEQDGTGDAVLGFAIKGTAAWQFGIDNSDSDKFKISYDGSGLASSTAVTLDRTGKVGINRTNPDQRLNVSGNIEVNAYDNTSGGNGYYTAKGLIIGNAYDAGKTSSDDRNAIIWNERGLDLDIATSDTLRMKIKYDGKIGIGTDSPKATYLHVGDNNGLGAGSVFTSSPLSVFASGNLGSNANDSHKIAIFGGRTSGNTSGLSIYHYRRANGTTWTTDGFSLRQEVDNTSSIYNYMTFAGGKVGINDPSPDSIFSVKDTYIFSCAGGNATTGMQIGGYDSGANSYNPITLRASEISFNISGTEKVRINSTGTTTFKGDSSGTEQIKIQSSGGGAGIFIANFQGLDAGDASSRLGVGKNDNALIFTNASGSQISNFAIGNTDAVPLVFSTNNTRRLHIRGDGRIIMGTGIPTYTNSVVHVEGSGINVESEYTFEDSTGSSPIFSLFGSNSHVRLDMGTLDVSPYAAYIQARYDNDPEQSGTSNSGLEPLMLNPRGGALMYNVHDSNASYNVGGGANSEYGGFVLRAGRANTATVNNTNTAIKIYPAEVRSVIVGEEDQGAKFGGIAWHGLDPHNGGWNAYGGHQCWMGMSYHSTPGQEFSNWQVQMNSNSTSGSYATNVAMQANPNGYVTKPSQPRAHVKISGSPSISSAKVTAWATPDYNLGDIWDATNSRFIAKIKGLYMIGGNFRIGAPGKVRVARFNLKVYNTSNTHLRTYGGGTGGGNNYDGGSTGYDHPYVSFTNIIFLEKNQYVELHTDEVGVENTSYIQTSSSYDHSNMWCVLLQ